MRKMIAALLLSQVLVPPALAQSATPADVETGRIVSVDAASVNFTVRSGTATRQFWTTRATRFRANHPNASFFDLVTGRRVAVTFHDSGPLEIADVVTY